jgi:hypothetical protein
LEDESPPGEPALRVAQGQAIGLDGVHGAIA